MKWILRTETPSGWETFAVYDRLYGAVTRALELGVPCEVDRRPVTMQDWREILERSAREDGDANWKLGG